MTELRAADTPDRREQLLVHVVDYVLEHGITQLTLRGLATAVGSNNRMLLYYFGSREELIVAALDGAGERFPGVKGVVTAIDDDTVAIDARLDAAWRAISDPVNLPFHRLFFEIFGLAGFEQQRFSALLGTISTEWVEHVSAAFSSQGVPDARADVLAHEVVALWRGLQATLISGGDSGLVEAAARDATASVLARLGQFAHDRG